MLYVGQLTANLTVYIILWFDFLIRAVYNKQEAPFVCCIIQVPKGKKYLQKHSVIRLGEKSS